MLKKSLIMVYSTVFLDLLGFGIILPWLPFYAAELGASGIGLGFLFTAYSLAQLVGASVLGRLSDRWGRRPVLLLSLLGAAIGFVLCGVATSLWFLCFARAVAGLFGGSISTAQAYVADVTSPQERGKYMGFVGASIGLGFVFGPAIGAFFISLGYPFRTVAFVAAGLAIANFLGGVLWLKESRNKTTLKKYRSDVLRSHPQRQELLKVFGAMFLTTFAFVGMETTFAFLGRDRFGLDNLRFGLVLTFVGVVMIVVQGGLVGIGSRRFGSRRLAIIGCVLVGLSLGLLPWAPNLPVALGILGLLAAGQGLNSPSLATFASQLTGQDQQGSVLGLGQSLAAAARAFGPLLAGALYDAGEFLPYLNGGILAIAAAGLLTWTSVRPQKPIKDLHLQRNPGGSSP